jgi:tetratricopeptide (TPR) repeat protein
MDLDKEKILRQAEEYASRGDLRLAIEEYARAASLDPDDVDVALKLADLLVRAGRTTEAIARLTAAGEALVRLERWQQAIRVFETVLRLDPENAAVRNRLADAEQCLRNHRNRVNALESLVEVVVEVGETRKAIEVLELLARLEPENPAHRQRLQSLGVSVEEITSTPTGPFAAPRCAADADDLDPTIMRDISDAERMARAGDNTSAILILEQVLERAPETVEAREHLRQLYTAERMEDRAADECRELARLYKATGDLSRAREMEELADALAPARGFGFEAQSPLGRPAFELDFGDSAPKAFDLSADFGYADDETPSRGAGFDLCGAEPEPAPAAGPAPSGPLSDAGPIISDAAVRDELEGVDFYIAQGYLEIARDTLDRLAASFPDNPEIERRYQKLKSTAELKAQMERIGTPEMIEQVEDAAEPEPEPEFDLSSMFSIETTEPEPEPEPLADEPFNIRSIPSPFSTSELPDLGAEPVDAQDLLGKSFAMESSEPTPVELSVREAGFDVSVEPEVEEVEEVKALDEADETLESERAADTGESPADVGFDVTFAEVDLLDELLGDLDTNFGSIDSQRDAEAATAVAAAPAPSGEGAGDTVLQEIFDEFKSSFDQDPAQDFDTHYNLGMAYRDMELLDDAIEEFQSAIRTTSPQAPDDRYVQCCEMLSRCFESKEMPSLAAMWLKKGLDAPGLSDGEQSQFAIDLARIYERLGDTEKAAALRDLIATSVPLAETETADQPPPTDATTPPASPATRPEPIGLSHHDDGADGTERDLVNCSVHAPARVAPDTTLLVQVFAHLPEQSAEAARVAREFDDAATRRAEKTLSARVAQGATLWIELAIPKLEVDDPRQCLIWDRRPDSAQFGVRVPADCSLGDYVGTVRIDCDDLPIGMMKFKLTVAAPAAARPDAGATDVEAIRFDKVFLTYAEPDRDLVLPRLELMRLAHRDPQQLAFFDDPARIADSDVCLVFWSDRAAGSDRVLRASREAVACREARAGMAPVIRPILVGLLAPAPPDFLAPFFSPDDRAAFSVAAPPAALGLFDELARGPAGDGSGQRSPPPLRRALVAGAGVLGVAVLGVAAFHFAGGPDEPPPAQFVRSSRGLEIITESGQPRAFYDESHALVIGVSRYDGGWPSLEGVAEDVTIVEAALRQQGFEVTTVTETSYAAIDRAVRDFISTRGAGADNRLVVYFAGHGATLPFPDGRVEGYVVPSDAPPVADPDVFKTKAISMTRFQEYAEQISSKHVLFVFDCCFSGTLVEKLRGNQPPVIDAKIAQPVRQIITAGSEGQRVPDKSTFAREFVQGLAGAADYNRDGFITGSELGMYLETTVTNLSKGSQTPLYCKIRNERLNKGDIVFENRPVGGE